MGKGRVFSDPARESVYQKQYDNEVYSSAAQQNSYNLGSTHFSDQSGIGNFTQAGSDQRKASIKGALFQGNIGFNQQTAVLDVPSTTIDLLEDSALVALSLVSTDRLVSLSAGTTSDLVTITGAQRPGQRLYLYGILGNTITIKHTVGATPNTILTPNEGDFDFSDNMVVELVYDISTSKWRIIGSPDAGSGEFFGPWTANHDAGGFSLLNLLSLDIEDSGGTSKLNISGPLGVGARFAFIAGDTVFFTENVTDRLSISASGLDVFTGDIDNIGTLSFDVTGTDIIVDTIGMLNTVPTGDVFDWTVAGSSKFVIAAALITAKAELDMGTFNIIGGGAGEGMTNVGHFDFIDNMATPGAALSIYSDGTDMLVNTGGGVVNLSDIGDGVFLDSTFRVQGSGDQTKQLAFEVDTFTTATTRTFGWPNADGTVYITPAQEDLDLNTFDIFDIDSLIFMPTVGTVGSLDVGFSSLGSGGFRANVLNNGVFKIEEENVDKFVFDTSSNIAQFRDMSIQLHETVGSTSATIAKFNGRIEIQDPTKISTLIGANTQWEQTDGFLTAIGAKGIIANIDQLGFRNTGNIIEDDAGGLIFTTIPGDDFTFDDGTDIFASLDKDLFAIQFASIQIPRIAQPPDPGANDDGKLFHNSSNNRMSYLRRNDGDSAFEVIDLEAGGGAQTPWIADIDAASFDLNELGTISFDIVGTDIIVDTIGVLNTVPTGDLFDWAIAGASKFVIANTVITAKTELDMSNNKIADIGETTITDLTLVTGATGDLVMIVDATDGLMKRVNVNDFLGGGSLTPWVSNIDANGFDLQDLSNIEFRDTTGAPGSSTNAIWTDSGGINIQAGAASDSIDLRLGANIELSLQEDGELIWIQDGHRLIPQGTAFQMISSSTTDRIELTNGTGSTNAILTLENTRCTWRTQTSSTEAYALQLIQNNNTPADFRTIVNIDMIAENSSSVDTIYARVSGSSQDITNATEDGLLQLGVVSGGTLIAAIDMEGSSASGANDALIGFFGETPVVQQVVAGGASVATVITALKNLGLFT